MTANIATDSYSFFAEVVISHIQLMWLPLIITAFAFFERLSLATP
jgi:hypothetical protein